MLAYVRGNLFESPAQTLVNTVNTVGVMGKGIALDFKRFYPDMFREYQRLCEEGRLRIGTLQLYHTPHKLILNFPTKTEWRKPSRLSYIEAGLRTFVAMYEQAGIRSVAFPPLGCGNGELSYDDVQPLMEHYLKPLPIQTFLYPPLPRGAAPEHRNVGEIRRWLNSEPRALPFNQVWEDLRSITLHSLNLHTYSKHTPFTASYIEDEKPGIAITASGRTGIYRRSEIRQVWSDLRAHGMATTRTVDSRHAAFLFPLLAALPYIAVVEVTNQFERFKFNNQAHALQIVPSAHKRANPQGSLALTV